MVKGTRRSADRGVAAATTFRLVFPGILWTITQGYGTLVVRALKKGNHVADILVLNGPNLNLLGAREPEIYGTETLDDVEARLRAVAAGAAVSLDFFQSNAEHDLVDRIHLARKEKVQMILINPGALTHTSISLRDAFLGVSIPFIEVHLSNIYARESFRSTSYLSDIATGVISGLGITGYELALRWCIQTLPSEQAEDSKGA